MTELNTQKVNLTIEGTRASGKLKYAIKKLLKKFFQRGNFVLAIELISSKKLKQFNLKYRSKDTFGEVLSFPLFKNQKEIGSFVKTQKAHPILLGTICLCPSFIKGNLKSKSQKEYDKRVLELVLHSIEHLVGIHKD